MKSSTLTIRIEPDLKQDTESILSTMGITTTQAITMFFEQVRLTRSIPFQLKIPNDETIEALKAGRTERGTPITIEELKKMASQ